MLFVAKKGAGLAHKQTASSSLDRNQKKSTGTGGRLAGWLSLVLLGCSCAFPVAAQDFSRVTLAWNPSADASVTGYRLYYGTVTGQYTNSIAVGNLTSCTVTGLVNGATYYFATTAFNTNGVESPFSNEVIYSVAFSRLQIAANSARQAVLTVQGATGHNYAIEATQDMVTWTVIGNVTPGANGLASFTDANSASLARRFYRLRDGSL